MKYYRALYSPEHFDDWNNSRFNSRHVFMPHEWIAKYYKENKRNEDDFPLTTDTGKFTVDGVRNFLRLAGKYEAHSIWEISDSLQACILDGVCAFSDRDSLFEFVKGNRFPDLSVVVFEGDYVSDIPESSGMTGVLVKPKDQGTTYSIEEFRDLKEDS